MHKPFIVRIFDNEGATMDRYTIAIIGDMNKEDYRDIPIYLVRASSNCDLPSGMYSIEEITGQKINEVGDLGKDISTAELPDKVLERVNQTLDDLDRIKKEGAV